MRLIAVCLFVAAVCAKHEEYTGWKSYFVGPKTQEQLKALGGLMQSLDLDFLGKPAIDREGLVLVKPEQQAVFEKTLEVIGVPHRVHADDVVKALHKDDEDIEEWNKQSMARNGGAKIPYDNYQPLSVDEQIVYLVVSPTSAHDRAMRQKHNITVSDITLRPLHRTTVFREWIAPPTVTWAIHKLLKDVTEPDLLERFDWILIPISNPDGYDFSHKSQRWWRKNRSVNPGHPMCPGTDGNRNYDFAWNTVGVSSNPCHETFPGSKPFSEIETSVIRDLLLEHLDRIALYLTMHSFGSMILYPWGHDGSLSPNAFALHVVGVAMADAIFENRLPHFPRYVVGNPVNVLGSAASGASEDYAHSIGVPLSYTYELPGFGWGLNGFNLHPRYIEQVCRETWEGIVVGARRAGDLF